MPFTVGVEAAEAFLVSCRKRVQQPVIAVFLISIIFKLLSS
jgi:hypothetical protein